MQTQSPFPYLSKPPMIPKYQQSCMNNVADDSFADMQPKHISSWKLLLCNITTKLHNFF